MFAADVCAATLLTALSQKWKGLEVERNYPKAFPDPG
jgi:hypothetical protein